MKLNEFIKKPRKDAVYPPRSFAIPTLRGFFVQSGDKCA
jgi:hypothetical protein